MVKDLLRLHSCLLVLCLLVDPTTASAMVPDDVHSFTQMELTNSLPFDEAALGSSGSAPYHGPWWRAFNYVGTALLAAAILTPTSGFAETATKPDVSSTQSAAAAADSEVAVNAAKAYETTSQIHGLEATRWQKRKAELSARLPARARLVDVTAQNLEQAPAVPIRVGAEGIDAGNGVFVVADSIVKAGEEAGIPGLDSEAIGFTVPSGINFSFKRYSTLLQKLDSVDHPMHDKLKKLGYARFKKIYFTPGHILVPASSVRGGALDLEIILRHEFFHQEWVSQVVDRPALENLFRKVATDPALAGPFYEAVDLLLSHEEMVKMQGLIKKTGKDDVIIQEFWAHYSTLGIDDHTPGARLRKVFDKLFDLYAKSGSEDVVNSARNVLYRFSQKASAKAKTTQQAIERLTIAAVSPTAARPQARLVYASQPLTETPEEFSLALQKALRDLRSKTGIKREKALYKLDRQLRDVHLTQRVPDMRWIGEDPALLARVRSHLLMTAQGNGKAAFGVVYLARYFDTDVLQSFIQELLAAQPLPSTSPDKKSITLFDTLCVLSEGPNSAQAIWNLFSRLNPTENAPGDQPMRTVLNLLNYSLHLGSPLSFSAVMVERLVNAAEGHWESTDGRADLVLNVLSSVPRVLTAASPGLRAAFNQLTEKLPLADGEQRNRILYRREALRELLLADPPASPEGIQVPPKFRPIVALEKVDGVYRTFLGLNPNRSSAVPGKGKTQVPGADLFSSKVSVGPVLAIMGYFSLPLAVFFGVRPVSNQVFNLIGAVSALTFVVATIRYILRVVKEDMDWTADLPSSKGEPPAPSQPTRRLARLYVSA